MGLEEEGNEDSKCAIFDPSTLDKQRICVNMQLKSSKKQLKRNVCVPKTKFNRSVCNDMRCHCVPFGPFHFHLGNKQMPVGF